MIFTPVMDQLFSVIRGMQGTGLFTKGNEIVLDEEKYQALRRELLSINRDVPDLKAKWVVKYLAIPSEKDGKMIDIMGVRISSRRQREAMERLPETEWYKGFEDGLRATKEDAKKAAKATRRGK